MNTAAQKQEPAQQKPTPIVDASKLPAVEPSGIANKAVKATAEQMKAFCKLILEGKPKSHIFPVKISEMDFTPEQRKEIQAARKSHKNACRLGKKALIKSLQSKGTHLNGRTENEKGTRGAVKWVKDEAFHGKDGKINQKKFNSEFGLATA
jgi:hypothetical protein